MLGNSATGRLAIVTEPTITMRMAITIATMGRLMKNFDIELPFLRFGSRGRKGLRVYLRPWLNFLHALSDNAFTRLQPFIDNPHGTRAVTDLDGSNAYLVLAVHDRHLIAALEFRHRALRNQQRTLLDSSRSSNPAIPSRAQNISRIWK